MVKEGNEGGGHGGPPLQNQSAGCMRISARACSRFASAVLFAVAALVSTAGARLLSFAAVF